MLYGEGRVCGGGGRECAQGIGGGVGVPNTDQLLTNLNNDLNLNASYLLNSYFQDDENTQQFFKTNLSSCYFDMQSFSNTYQHCKEPLFISLNIQSLNSKFSELKSFIAELGKVNIFIDLIILQETWNVVFSELLELPGYQPLISRNRRNMRGGGVGVYVRKGLNYKVKNNFEIFRHKTFENITLELAYQNKNFLISNIYHSPNPPNGCTQQAHHNDFLDILDGHLSDLSGTDKDVYVFLDANIDLLKLNSLELARNYMDVNISNGFLQLITKATRIQGSHYSLIDHILTNTNLD
jgi:exonuclease III